MKVCAEYEDQITAMVAQKKLLEDGIDANDIEIRSPYPLSEVPLPAHKSGPMNMRFVVRCMWAFAVCFGFSFVSYTQFEWGPVAHTGTHPLIAPPITMLVTYECGMITAIWTTTFMFFLETFRHRQLVPPLEEDMPVAIGYVCVIVAGKSADRAVSLFEGSGARSVVTYGLAILLGLGSMFSTGCARFNMREQDVIKSTEARSEYAPAHSLRMEGPIEQKFAPPAPMVGINSGDTDTEMKLKAAEAKKFRAGRDAGVADKAGDKAKADEFKAEQKSADDEKTKLSAQLKAMQTEPKLYALKALGSPPKEMKEWKNPVPSDAASLDRGGKLFYRNCSACHGVTGQGEGKVGEVEYIQPPKLGDAKAYGKVDDGYFYYYIFTGKNLMPPFGYRLTNAEICDVINYIRGMQSGKVSKPYADKSY